MSTGLFILPSLNVGGAENVAFALAEWMKSHTEVHFVTFEGGNNAYGVDRTVLSNEPIWSGPGRRVPKLFWEACVELERVKQRLRPDFSLSFTELPNIANALTGSELRALSLHSAISKNLSRRTQPFILPLLHATHSCPIYGVSEGVKADYEAYVGSGRSLVSVIPNPMNFEELALLASERLPEGLGFLTELEYAVSVGRLVEPKNQLFLLRLAAREEFPDIKLVLVGDGPMRQLLENECDRLNLSFWTEGEYRGEQVVFAGHLANPFPALKAARVFLFPSLWEGFGMALLEALGLRVPAISSDCQHGPREIFSYPADAPNPDPTLRFETGSLVGGYDYSVWLEELSYWLTTPTKVDTLLERYSIQKIGSQWLRVLGLS